MTSNLRCSSMRNSRRGLPNVTTYLWRRQKHLHGAKTSLSLLLIWILILSTVLTRMQMLLFQRRNLSAGYHGVQLQAHQDLLGHPSCLRLEYKGTHEQKLTNCGPSPAWPNPRPANSLLGMSCRLRLWVVTFRWFCLAPMSSHLWLLEQHWLNFPTYSKHHLEIRSAWWLTIEYIVIHGLSFSSLHFAAHSTPETYVKTMSF